MEPGALTELLIDDQPAFRVSFDCAAAAADLRYFRAIVLWDFDGATLARSRDPRRPARRRNSRRPLRPVYRITLEPSRPLPAGAGSSAGGAGRRPPAGRPRAARRRGRSRSRAIYRCARRCATRSQPTLDAQRARRGLRLPAGFDPRTHALADALARSARHDDDGHRARRARSFPRRRFSYTLKPPLLGRDSVDDFLFDTQQGFCEHYASAFVVLMRAAGIPARVVTGYQGGWWNELGNYLLVRNSDAHAWAEVWMAGRGWVRVDPTAAVSPARMTLGAAAAAGERRDWYQSDWLRACATISISSTAGGPGRGPLRRVAPARPADAVRRGEPTRARWAC